MESDRLDQTDRERLSAWYLQYNDWLCGYLQNRNRKYSFRLSNEEISDIAINTLLILLQQLNNGKFVMQGENKLQSWLKKTGRYSLSNYRKRHKATIVDFEQYQEYTSHSNLETSSHLEQLEDKFYKDKMLQCLLECIHSLPVKDQTLINLYYLRPKKMKVKKIAEMMGQNESWVKGRLFQIRNKIRKHLADNGFDNPGQILDGF